VATRYIDPVYLSVRDLDLSVAIARKIGALALCPGAGE
jgi:hypothetical protein